MPEIFKNSTDKRIELENNIYDFDTNESFKVIDTYLLAENKEFKEFSLVDYYDGEFAVNVEVEHKAEVVIQLEEWTKRLYFDWKGQLSFYDFVQHLENNIEDEFFENKLKGQGCKYVKDYKERAEEGPFLMKMYNQDGEVLDVYLRKHQLLSSVVSVRLVDFKMDIID